MEQQSNISPEESIEEFFFYSFVDCVLEEEKISEETFYDNEEKIISFLWICYKERLNCYQTAELLMNISQNFL